MDSLDGHQVLASEVEAAAKEGEISIASLKQVKLAQGVTSSREAGKWYWVPPEEDNPAA